MLLRQSLSVLGDFAAHAFLSVHTWWVAAALEVFRRAYKENAEAAAQFSFRTGITCHGIKNLQFGVSRFPRGHLNAASLGRTATIVWHRGDVFDDGDFKTDRLKGANRGLTAGTGTFDPNLNFFNPVAHGLTGGILGN